MPSTLLCAVFFSAYVLTFSAAQTSCKGRCGAEYYRGYMCQCDYNCLQYKECCKDYESQCTTKNSCQGRCGETFRRGRLCSCDSDCIKYKQCCPDYVTHCDAEEEFSGAASAATPVKTSSCDNVNNNKAKESNLSEAQEQPEESPTDVNSQFLPNDDFSNSGQEEANLFPEGTSGLESSPADWLDQVTTEPTHEPNTVELSQEMVNDFTQTKMTPTQGDDSSSSPQSTDVSDPLISTSAGTSSPQPTTAADHISSKTPVTSAPQMQVPSTASSPETNVQTTTQPQDDLLTETQKTNPTEATSDVSNPDVSTPPFNNSTSTGTTQDYADHDMTQVTSIPVSSTQDLTSIPDETTSNPEPRATENISEDTTTSTPSALADTQHPSSTVSPTEPVSDHSALTTRITSSSVAAQDDTPDVTPQESTHDSLNVTPDLTKPQPPEPTSKPQDKPVPTYKPAPNKPTEVQLTSKPETHSQNIEDPRDFQADDSNDTNLCSGRPVGAVTTLRNGTVVVFRGHYFWFLNRNRQPGPAQGITQVWGVPSPIDTAFTRCNCQGKTYIFKGSLYWRYENDALDPGYPKVIETGFDGLRGQVTAALSVPQHRRRRESVYFFKRGGLVQKYSYQSGTSPTCGRRVQYAVYTVRNRMTRQAVSLLDPPINIRTSWRGFPTTVTAAVSVPSTTEPDGYKYYVFSRSKSYNVRMDGERPVIAAPTVNAPLSNNVFRC